MDTDTITIRVAPHLAQAFKALPSEQQHKLEVLLNLRLLEITQQDEPLEDVMRDISRKAQARGLTPEIMQSILDEV